MKRFFRLTIIVLISVLVFTACDSKINEPKEEGAFKIGNTRYETLQDAVDSLKGARDLSTYTITLTKDVSDRGAIISGIAGNVRLDLGIYKYTLVNSSKGIKIDNGNTQVEIYGGVLAVGTGNTVAMLITSNSDTKINGTEVNISETNIDAIVARKGALSIEGDTAIRTREEKKAISVSNNAVVAIVSNDVLINGTFEVSGNAIVIIEHGTVTGGFLLSENAEVNVYEGNVTVTKLDCPEGADNLINLIGDTTVNTIGDDLALNTKLAKISHYHTFSTDLSKDANYHWHASTCGHDVVKDKARHIWDDGKELFPAAGGKAGSIEYTCLVCGYTRTEVLAPANQDAIAALVNNYYNSANVFVRDNINKLSGFSLDPTKVKWNGSFDYNGNLPVKFSYRTSSYYEKETEYGSSSGFNDEEASATITYFKANPGTGLTDFYADYTIKTEDGSSVYVKLSFVYSENNGLKTSYLISDGKDSYSLVHGYDHVNMHEFYQKTTSSGEVIELSYDYSNYYDDHEAFLTSVRRYVTVSNLYNLVQEAFSMITRNSFFRLKALNYNDGEISVSGQGDLSLIMLVENRAETNELNFDLTFEAKGSFNLLLQAYGIEMRLGLSLNSGSLKTKNNLAFGDSLKSKSITDVDVTMADIDVSVSYQKLKATLGLSLADVNVSHINSSYNNTSDYDFSGSGKIGVRIYLTDGENDARYEGRLGIESISREDIMNVDMAKATLTLANFDLDALARLFGVTYSTVTSKINGKNVNVSVLLESFFEDYIELSNL